MPNPISIKPSDDGESNKTAGGGSNTTEKLEHARDVSTTVSMVESYLGQPFEYIFAVARPQINVNFVGLYRGHFIFDLSNAPAGTILSADLCLYAYVADTGGTINNGHKFYIIGHDYGGDLNSATNDVNPTNNTTGDWTDTDVPTYSLVIIVNGVSAGDKIIVELNSTAITEINNQVASGDFDIGLCTHYDYKDDFTLTPSIVDNQYNGVQVGSSDHSDSSYHPVLELTYGGPTTGPIKIEEGAKIKISSGKLFVGLEAFR